jgi:hypothetical protein
VVDSAQEERFEPPFRTREYRPRYVQKENPKGFLPIALVDDSDSKRS